MCLLSGNCGELMRLSWLPDPGRFGRQQPFSDFSRSRLLPIASSGQWFRKSPAHDHFIMTVTLIGH